VIDAGLRDKLVAFVRPSITTDDHGGEAPGASNQIAQAWVRIRHGTGAERRDAAQKRATIAATFECNWTPLLATVIETDKISFDGTWDIISRAPIRQNDEIHFTAIRAD